MRVFLAGATGAIGRPLVERLRARGHELTASTRSPERAAQLRERGVTPVVLDVYDRNAVHTALADARPEVVIHQLTALPKSPTPFAIKRAFAETARLRRETVPTFASAAPAAGARRFIAQSISFVVAPEGPSVLDESARIWLDGPAEFRENAEAVRVLEDAALGTSGIESIVLRYGFYYGAGTWYAPDGTIGKLVRQRFYPIIGTGEGLSSFVHIDDAAEATVLAAERGAPGIYNITDDEPVSATTWITEIAELEHAPPPRHMPAWLARPLFGPTLVHYATTLRGASNAKAKRELGWQPRPWREGFREVFAKGAD